MIFCFIWRSGNARCLVVHVLFPDFFSWLESSYCASFDVGEFNDIMECFSFEITKRGKSEGA